VKFGASRSQLYDAQKTARARWETTSDSWNDSTQVEFEEQIWIPLDQQVSNVLRAVDSLSVLFAQVRQDCEFNP